VDKKSRCVIYKKTDKKDDWKPKKCTTPDVGTYNPTNAMKLIKRSTQVAQMGKSNLPTFIDKFASYTKNNPSVGKYDPEKAEKRLYRPLHKYR
jgi:hypothetical protein